MHTAICSFDDRAQAEQTVERLVQAGYDRGDIHLKYRDGSPGVLATFGHFFTSLFGQDDVQGHAGTYSSAVDRGQYVVIVDAADDTGAMRAQHMMHAMEADNLNVVHRTAQPALRDIVAGRQMAMTGADKDSDEL
jgi:hypothetical protein